MTEPAECGFNTTQSLTGDVGLVFPMFRGDYLRGSLCSWLLKLESPTASFRLSLESMDIQDGAVVSIFDGDSPSAALLTTVDSVYSQQVRLTCFLANVSVPELSPDVRVLQANTKRVAGVQSSSNALFIHFMSPWNSSLYNTSGLSQAEERALRLSEPTGAGFLLSWTMGALTQTAPAG